MKFNFLTIDKSKLNSYFVLLIIFSFPFITLLNYIFDIQSGILSYAFRGIVLLISSYYIGLAIYKNSIIKTVYISFVIFWILYFSRIIIDLEYFNIASLGSNSKQYYYFYAILVNFIPLIAMAFIKPINFDYLTSKLSLLLKIFVSSILLLIIHDYLNENVFFASGRLWIRSNDFEFLNPITIGLYCATLIILLIYKKDRKSIDLLFLFLCFFIIGLTASRAPIVFIAAIVGLIFIIKPSIIISKRIDVIYCFIITIIVLIILNFNPYLGTRLISSTDQSSMLRLEILKSAFTQISNNPITGTHFLVLPNFISHNLFVDIMLSLGILGLLLLIPSFLLFFKAILNDKMKTAIYSISLLYFFTIQTSGAIFNYNEFWYLFSLILSNYYYEKKFKLVER